MRVGTFCVVLSVLGQGDKADGSSSISGPPGPPGPPGAPGIAGPQGTPVSLVQPTFSACIRSLRNCLLLLRVPEVPQADKVPPGTGVPQVVEDPEGLKVSLVRPVLT